MRFLKLQALVLCASAVQAFAQLTSDSRDEFAFYFDSEDKLTDSVARSRDWDLPVASVAARALNWLFELVTRIQGGKNDNDPTVRASRTLLRARQLNICRA